MTDTEYSFSVAARLTTGGTTRTYVDSFDNNVRMHAEPELKISKLYGERVLTPLSGSDWKVFWYTVVWLYVKGTEDGHEFALETPSGTGLQAKSTETDIKCDWSHPDITTSGWTASDDDFYLVRCAVGDGSTRLKILSRVSDGNGWAELGTYATKTVLQAWHQADNTVKYIQPSASTTTISFPTAVATAVATWNSAVTGVKFCEGGCSGDNKDAKQVAIVVATPRPTPTPGAVATPVASLDCGRHTVAYGAVACVPIPWGVKPDMGNVNMYILDPPHFYDTSNPPVLETYIWTNNRRLIGTDPYIYLPMVITHEFGHTAGLGHSPTQNSIDVMGDGFEQRALSQTDVKAMEANYAGHSPHSLP